MSEDTTASARGAQAPFEWGRLSFSRIATDPAFRAAMLDPPAFATMWELALYSWNRGVIPESLPIQGERCFDRLLAIGALVHVEGGFQVPWLEEMRAEGFAYKAVRSDLGRRGRKKQLGSARLSPAKPRRARLSPAQPGQDDTEKRDVQGQSDLSLRSLSSAHPDSSTNPPERPAVAGEHTNRLPEKPPEPDSPKTPQAALVLWWQGCWKHYREVDYVPLRKDFVAAAALLKLGSSDEIKRRACRMLESDEEFYLRSADLTLLASHWNRLGARPELVNGHETKNGRH